MRGDQTLFDGVLANRLKYCAHEERLYTQTVQPSRDQIMKNTAAQRREGVSRKTETGYLLCQVPLLDYMELRKRNPDMAAPDPQIRKRAWLEFAQGPGKAYALHETKRGSVKR